MALMSPFQQAFNVDTNLTFAPPLQLDTNTYSGNSPSGEATPTTQQPSVNFTEPSTTLTTQQQANQQAQLTAKAIQDNTAQQQSPYGISPSSVGSVAGKAFNTLSGKTGPGTFSSQVQALDQFGATNLGTGASLAQPFLGASVGDATGGIDAYTAASSGLGETVSPAVAAADAAATPGATAAAGAIAPLSSILGAGAIGALGGGFLAKALGENQLGGSIGGGIGAAAGMAFGAAGAAALGLELGSFAGPIGALAGGAIGAVVGGLFGNNSTPTNASGYSEQFTPQGNAINSATGGKNPNSLSTSTTASTANNFSQILQAASQQLGLKVDPNIEFGAGFSSKHGGASLYVSNTQTNSRLTGDIGFNQNDPSSINAAYKQALTAVAQASGYTDINILNSWFDKMSQGQNNAPPSAPSIPVSQSFADYVNSKQGTSNAGNGSAVPTVAPAH